MPTLTAPQKPPAETDALTRGPSIILDPSALGLLSGDVSVLAHFLQFVRRDVLQEHVPATRIEVRGSVDPEDDTSQIIVRVWMRGMADGEIRGYHHALGGRADDWAAGLPDAQKLFFVSRISFQARREADA